MSEISTPQRPTGNLRRIADLEQQLLALGPMPLRDEELWDAAHWARYAEIMRELSAELTVPTGDRLEPAHHS